MEPQGKVNIIFLKNYVLLKGLVFALLSELLGAQLLDKCVRDMPLSFCLSQIYQKFEITVIIVYDTPLYE